MLLLHRWKELVRRHAGEVALADVPAGRTWTFGELDAAGEAAGEGRRESRLAVVGGQDGSFVVETLGAWHRGDVLCPVETGVAPSVAAGGWLQRLPKEIVHVKWTSGSTGEPRAVIFRAEQLVADADNIVSTMKLGREVPNVAAISLAHSYGFSNLVLTLLLHGIPLFLAGSPLPESVRRAMERAGRPCALPGVPAMWRAWLAAGIPGESVRVAISAGAPLPAELEREAYAKSGVKIHNFLGSSECGGIAYDRTDWPREDAGSVGTAMDGVTLDLEAGRLVVRGAAVAEGYWPAEADEEGVLGGGRFLTADLAAWDGGALHLRGRAGDVINVAGRKVHPSEIEAVVRTVPAVRECVAFAVPEGAATGRAEEIGLCVALDAGGAADPLGAIRAAVAAQLPTWKQPRHWFIDPTLSANERGKIPRHLWRERCLARQGAAV